MDRDQDRETGSVAAEEGIRLATNATPSLVRDKIDLAIKLLAASGEPFTSDDVWEHLDRNHVNVDHPNVIGGRFQRMSHRKVIRRTGEYTKSRRYNRHGSLVFFYIGYNA